MTNPTAADAEQARLATALAAIDWDAAADGLERRGAVRLGPLLSASACAALRGLYADATRFRKTVVMARHGYGSGEYRYFADPPPDLVTALQRQSYARLAPIANRLAARLGRPEEWPADFTEMAARSAAAGQTAPTPLLLRYGPGDFNCLHQDVYGEVAFPLQLVVSLSQPGVDFEGGEFVVVENRPRRQSVPTVVLPNLGEGVLFATREAPRQGPRGWSRAQLRHGVSAVAQGDRMTLGIIYHGAKP